MTAAAADLVAGFSDPVLDSQAAFRGILDAMAHPGHIVRIATCPEPPAGLHPASFALALTLLDADTPVWLSGDLRTAPIEASLRFHCGCRLVTDTSSAAFAFAVGTEDVAIGAFPAGEERYPDRSTTLILQLAGFSDGPDVVLAGPGIETKAPIRPNGLRAGFWADWATNHARYPLGVDLLLASGDVLMALPRSTAARPVEG